MSNRPNCINQAFTRQILQNLITSNKNSIKEQVNTPYNPVINTNKSTETQTPTGWVGVAKFHQYQVSNKFMITYVFLLHHPRGVLFLELTYFLIHNRKLTLILLNVVSFNLDLIITGIVI